MLLVFDCIGSLSKLSTSGIVFAPETFAPFSERYIHCWHDDCSAVGLVLLAVTMQQQHGARLPQTLGSTTCSILLVRAYCGHRGIRHGEVGGREGDMSQITVILAFTKILSTLLHLPRAVLIYRHLHCRRFFFP